MVYEIFDLYGFADLWQKVVRLSPPNEKFNQKVGLFLFMHILLNHSLFNISSNNILL